MRERERVINKELNEKVALAIGWTKREDGTWLNFWGGHVKELPDFSGDETYAQVVVRHFEPSIATRCDGTHEAFSREYNEQMSPTEICNLSLKVLSKKEKA